MATADVTVLPIVDDGGSFLGEVALADVLKARRRHLEEETRRERVYDVPRLIPQLLRVPLGELSRGADALRGGRRRRRR